MSITMAHSANFSFSPVTLEMNEKNNGTSLSIKSSSAEAINIQIRVFEWFQNKTNDDLKITDDIVVSPPLLRLEPNQSYNFRLVKHNIAKFSGEKAYRIIIDEVPTPSDSRKKSPGIQVRLRTSIPLFISDENATTLLRWKKDLTENGGTITISNIGTRHALITELSLVDQITQREYKIKTDTLNGYILPGNEKKFYSSDFFHKKTEDYSIRAKVNGRFYENREAFHENDN